LHEKSIIAIVTVIVTDFLAFVFRDTHKNESQEYQIFVRKFWRMIGLCVYTFLCVEKARNYNGLFVISTTEVNLSAEDILKIYREKDIIEKAFRAIKSEIGLRPFFLSSDESVTGYVFICALAYQVRSILRFLLKKSNSEMSIEEAFEILDRLKVVKISVKMEGVQVYRKVSVGGQRAIDVIHCFDVDTEFDKISGLNSV
jgi:transposase